MELDLLDDSNESDSGCVAEIDSGFESALKGPTRRHFTRLRHYWHGKARGAPSLTDSIDLDLAAAGLICRRNDDSGVVHFVITEAGVKELSFERDREIARRRPHHDLAGRLSEWLRDKGRITWENIELIARDQDGQQAVRPDVFSLVSTYDSKRINPAIYEVKVSRSDFLCDIAKPQKRSGYFKLSEVFFYVCPLGMIEVSDLPEGCGLLVEVDIGNFKVLKKPKKRKIELTVHHFMNLILKPGKANSLFK